MCQTTDNILDIGKNLKHGMNQGWQFLPLSGNFRKKLRKKWKGTNTFFRGRNGRNGRNEIKS